MNARIFRAMPLVATGLAVSAVALGLARLTWTLAGEVPTSPPTVTRQFLPNSAIVAPANIDAILTLAPFGTPVRAATASGDGAKSALPVSLVLQGVLLSADPSRSQAIIIAAGGRPQSYKPGDILPGGASLLSVEKTRVLLRVAGHEEVLEFPVPLRTAASIAGFVQTAMGAPVKRVTPPIDQIIAEARERIGKNPKAVLDELGVEASADGYRIGATSPMTRRAGFKPGDIVQRVNGVAVGNVESDRQLFEDVVASGSARVELLRDGQPTILTFPLR